MSKIEISTVAKIITTIIPEPAITKPILEAINEAAAAKADNEETPPPVKKQWCILISDPEGTLPENDLVGWVLQIPENESVLTTQERIHRAAYEFNTTKKGRMLPAEKMGDAIENIPAKHFKEQQVWIKSKTPVLMLRTDNKIPMEKKE